MKTLVNCTPSEFLRQTSRIKKSVEKWLDITEIMSIRQKKPDGLKAVDNSKTKEENIEAIEYNKELWIKQAQKNLSEMLDIILDKYPDETLELLALMCFIEPSDINNHKTSELLLAFNEIIQDEAVMGFFSSLVRLGRTNTARQ